MGEIEWIEEELFQLTGSYKAFDDIPTWIEEELFQLSGSYKAFDDIPTWIYLRRSWMSKQDAHFYGALAGITPAIWTGAYMFHILPPGSVFDAWWSFPWYMTAVAVFVLIPVLFALYFGWMAEDE